MRKTIGLILGLCCLLAISWKDSSFLQRNANEARQGAFLNGKFPKRSANPYAFSQTYRQLPLEDKQYTKVVPVPGTEQLLLVGKNGELWAFDDSPGVSSKLLVLDISEKVANYSEAGVTGIAFHPQFDNPNSAHYRELFLFYTYKISEELPIYDRLSRFRFAEDLASIDEGSEEILIQQYDRGFTHNAGELFFDQEGFLYLTLGDEGNTNGWTNDNPQSLDKRLFSGILRIDVDNDPSRSHSIRRLPIPPSNRPADAPGNINQGYSIPRDNPWVDESGRYLEEFYVIGLRNPYSAFLDTLTGDLWVADVGDQSREEINIFQKGDNGQWGYKEGTLDARLTPRPENPPGAERPPLYEYSRDQGTSVMAGLVYRGSKYPNLDGKFLFCDWTTGNVWAYDKSSENPVEVVFRALPKIVDFFINIEGDIVALTIRGQMHRLTPRTRPDEAPALLSETGAFSDVLSLTPAEGVDRYQVNSPLWSDGASKDRWIALPKDSVIQVDGDGWIFPVGTVFIKHFEMPINEDSVKRLETRFIVMSEDNQAYGLTYRWNEKDTEAWLVGLSEALKDTIITNSPLARVAQVWDYPTRSQCLRCHNESAGYVLGFKATQLDQPTSDQNQLDTFHDFGYFDEQVMLEALPMTGLGDSSATLERRIRSYLDANCSHCHQPATGLNSFDARYETPLTEQGMLNRRAGAQNSDANNFIIAPGNLGRSELWRRDTSQTAIQMPPLALNVLDSVYLEQLADWITGLKALDAAHQQVPGNPLRVYPNPIVNDQFTVSITASSSTLRLFDQMGRQVPIRSQAMSDGETAVSMDPTSEAGVYQLIVQTEKGLFTTRVVKVN